MYNQTQQYAQLQLDIAQDSMRPHGISLGLRGVKHNTLRAIDRGVKAMTSSAIGANRQYKKAQGVDISEQKYMMPLVDRDNNPVYDNNGKPAKVLIEYGTIVKVNPDHAQQIRDKLRAQAQGLTETVNQMEQCASNGGFKF